MGVRVWVAVLLEVGVRVSVSVEVCVKVGVRVMVGVGVNGICVRVAVAVWVAVGVYVLEGEGVIESKICGSGEADSSVFVIIGVSVEVGVGGRLVCHWTASQPAQ